MLFTFNISGLLTPPERGVGLLIKDSGKMSAIRAPSGLKVWPWSWYCVSYLSLHREALFSHSCFCCLGVMWLNLSAYDVFGGPSIVLIYDLWRPVLAVLTPISARDLSTILKVPLTFLIFPVFLKLFCARIKWLMS